MGRARVARGDAGGLECTIESLVGNDVGVALVMIAVLIH